MSQMKPPPENPGRFRTMLERTLSRLLRMYPRGADDRQLIARLRQAGLAVSPSELLEGLMRLSETGEIRRDSAGRWRAARSAINADAAAQTQQIGSATGELLHAASARIVDWVPEILDAADAAGAGEMELPAADRLLAYYAATQRRDPRGAIETYPDRHSEGWQLLQANGRWWHTCEITVSMSQLPPSFRQALMKRREQSAALGWPIAAFGDGLDGRVIAPALLIAADWRIDDDRLIIMPDPVSPALNPAWTRRAARDSGWSQSGLVDVLMPPGEADGLEDIAERLRYALARSGGGVLRPASLEAEMSPDLGGMNNIAALFLPDSSTFSAATAADLELLSQWGEAERANTALAAIFAKDRPVAASTYPILSGTDLTDRQLEAADAALSGPLCAVQGPPGTGKSQLILSLILTLAVEGRSVLFASRNHQALDEVENRLEQIVRPAPLLTRARDSSGERNTSFYQALKEIGQQEAERATGDAKGLSKALDWARSQALARAQRRRVDAVSAELSALAERREELEQSGDLPTKLGLLHRLINAMRTWLQRKRRLPQSGVMTLGEVERRRATLRDEHAQLELDGPALEEARPLDDAELVSAFSAFAMSATNPDAKARAEAAERVKELEFEGLTRGRDLTATDAELVLAHRPIWAVSTQSAPNRIPLIAGLFDYLIIDEASQCDIATAMPLFARAKKAVIVGDPQQLGFVPPLGRGAEQALMTSIGLPRQGRARFAQSINSLFEFIDRRPASRRAFLADQFRSAPAIVEYLNEEFYRSRRLEGRRGDDEFATPQGFKTGLVWQAVKGTAQREGGGPVNLPEAEEVCRLIQQMAADREFDGQVGVVSPFNAQVALIKRMLDGRIPSETRERLRLKVATIDRFQGGESDIILFSLVANGGSRSGQQFLRGERKRLNVAVSRARALCIVIGDLEYATSSVAPSHIRKLAERATRRVLPPVTRSRTCAIRRVT